MAALLSRKLVLPGGGMIQSAAGPFGDAVNALTAALLDGIAALDDAVRTWPPKIESTGKGPLTARAMAVHKCAKALKKAPPKVEDFAPDAQTDSASLISPMRTLGNAMLDAAELVIDAFGAFLPVERNFLDEDEEGGPAGGLARVSAGGRIADAFKGASKMARILQEAFRNRDVRLARSSVPLPRAI